MKNIPNRKYSRRKIHEDLVSQDKSLVLSGKCAAGIMSLVFLNGLFWGYILKKNR